MMRVLNSTRRIQELREFLMVLSASARALQDTLGLEDSNILFRDLTTSGVHQNTNRVPSAKTVQLCIEVFAGDNKTQVCSHQEVQRVHRVRVHVWAAAPSTFPATDKWRLRWFVRCMREAVRASEEVAEAYILIP